MAKTLKVAVQMDPIESINIDADSTFALMLEAQARGHAQWHYHVRDLALHGGRVTARLLAAADELYLRSGAGVFSLPPDCRMGIAAARHIYAAIGSEVARQGHDSVTRRARTSRGQKLVLMGRALAGSALTHVLPRPAQLHARPVPEVAFLIEAAGQRSARPQRSETLLAILAQLEARDRRGAAG